MTVIDFYAAHALDGRAMLQNGMWIVRARNHYSSTLWLCHADAMEIELLDPLMDVRFLERRKVTQPAAWHRAIVKSVRLERLIA